MSATVHPHLANTVKTSSKFGLQHTPK